MATGGIWHSTKALLKRTPLRLLHAYLRSFRARKGQSDETEILDRLIAAIDVPKTFVEFGFHVHEFNCIALTKTFRGLLIDGDEGGVKIARRFLPANIEVAFQFLSLDNMDFIERRFAPGALGVLSIDVDGNDYWFVERLIALRPAIIVAEYNASLGLRPLSVPYDPRFQRHEKHPSGWYHGASMTALERLGRRHGYDFVAVTSGGGNMFFVRSDLRPAAMPILSPQTAYRENLIRNTLSGTIAEQQWAAIAGLAYVTIE